MPNSTAGNSASHLCYPSGINGQEWRWFLLIFNRNVRGQLFLASPVVLWLWSGVVCGCALQNIFFCPALAISGFHRRFYSSYWKITTKIPFVFDDWKPCEDLISLDLHESLARLIRSKSGGECFHDRWFNCRVGSEFGPNENWCNLQWYRKRNHRSSFVLAGPLPYPYIKVNKLFCSS